MGWVWRDDEDDELKQSTGDITEFRNPNSKSGDQWSTRKVIKSQCKTEEVEPGKFVRKCEKTEQILRDCVGKPVEVVQSNKEYTEDDVTDELLKGSFPFGSSGSENGLFSFPGLQSDIEAMEHSFLGGLTRFFEAAEDMKNGFFNVFDRAPHLFDGEPSSSPSRRGIPIEGHPCQEAFPKPEKHESGNADLSGLARDV
ncbi:Mal d 1-associated protein [Quillaja saponaria]|uniref:Mal d 1-associated protein n=1 Tax=Quillaja saponaria TaxID=32244 RepID=A0AAD7VCU6_QUISA|nr:Mal d 1-associated protein [Quillaja saponaria]